MAGDRSNELWSRAEVVLPGGVSSPVRAFRAVGGEPVFFARGAGARLWDADGKEYLDYVGSWGPLILGHAHPEVVQAICEAAGEGTTFGAPTEREVRYAEALHGLFPSMERLRFVSSGTEATMSAIRLARGYTGKNKIIKIDGGYHGHADCLLVEAGSGAATHGVPGSAGVPARTVADTVIVPWNNLDALSSELRAYRGEIAALIVEPVPANMGVVPPHEGYLAQLRALATNHDALLIFDEVITGFRLGPSGAQGRYQVTPDLTCLGKILGGGLPAACFGGRADVMRQLAPQGPVYQAGTLSGNPLAMAAGLKTVEILGRPGTYERLEEAGARLERALREAADGAGARVVINRVGSMLTAFFGADRPVVDFTTAKRTDKERFARFFRACLSRGVYLPPSQYEALFVSLAHSDGDLERTAEVFSAAMREAK